MEVSTTSLSTVVNAHAAGLPSSADTTTNTPNHNSNNNSNSSNMNYSGSISGCNSVVNSTSQTVRSHSSAQLARKIRRDLKNTSSLVKGILGLSISLTSTSHHTTITYEDVTLCSTSRYVLS